MKTKITPAGSIPSTVPTFSLASIREAARPSTAEKNTLISLRILALVSEGNSHKEAIDTVLGTGTYDKLVTEIYHGLRAKVTPVR